MAIRRKVLEGDLVDVELEAAIERFGLFGGLQWLMQRRFAEKIEREFLTAGLPDGVEGPVTDIDFNEVNK